ncbi:uncharacterized protein LOC114518533 isoform X2 [Dendronephthya gigantea]|uniref:uncharacterized protein LOC114518533 isoform X2 n=1 Tax=Dendronephthya gigantea TaxID=151771 RepID=UPI00106AA681|nr:uncharacterized protein LOC114518533 isoform X2 [Dendronephthya gigantea]
MAQEMLESLSEAERAQVADQILPGIYVFLDKLLVKEHISEELESLRQSYVAILQCSYTESPQIVRKNVDQLAESFDLKYEASDKSGRFGRIREKRLINIRQFHFKQNQRKQERRNKMDDNRLAVHTDDESRLIPKSSKKTRATTDSEDSGQVNLGTDDENRNLTGTDDERRVSTGGESFVELSNSDLTGQKYSKVTNSNINQGNLYCKEIDGLRQRWIVLDGSVLKCYKKQNQNLLFEVNFSDGGYSAIRGRIGKMFAIRLSGTKASSSHLFASPKVETIASWMIAFSGAGVRLQDEILREVSMNHQNNNKVKWSLDDRNFSGKDEFRRSELLEALEFIERSRSPCILPKRSSYSFKELDVLKKLKSSLAAKKAECKLNRRKTWSAGTFPIANLTMLERFRKPITGSDGIVIDQREDKETVKGLASQSLPEILTSSGVVPKEDRGSVETPVESAEQLVTSEEDFCYTKSMPEGLNKQPASDVIEVSQSPRGSINAQSVPDLLIHPGQESPRQTSSPKMEPRQLKPSISLTRVVSMKASLMKNAIISGWKRKGRRGSGIAALDPELSDIHGCLFRKKGLHWKLRWCAVSAEIFYVYRDSQYSQEDFRCNLRKCVAVSTCLEPGRSHSFKLVRRKGDEILLAAEDGSELWRWLSVLQRATSKSHSSEGDVSRSSSLTVSLFGSDTVGDSSAAEDTPPEKRNSNYCETTDKDSSDEQSTTSSISTKIRSRGLPERGYVYYLVKQDTWEHCWMEVSFGVLSIYNNETRETALQRDHVALCDVQQDSANGQRAYSFVLKKPGRHPIYFAVDTERDFLKWKECFNSWKKRPVEERSNPTEEIPERASVKRNYLDIPRSSPVGETPVTSDSDCCGEGTDSKANELAERPKIRRSMTDVFLQITPKLKRTSQSSVGAHETDNCVIKNGKSSFLYYKASSGLWVKYWCVLDLAVIYCFNSPEDSVARFSVEIHGCEIRRTSCKSKNFTFDVFNRNADKHYEFAGESTYVMYAWMRVLKIAAGSEGGKGSNSGESFSATKYEEPVAGNEKTVENVLRTKYLKTKTTFMISSQALRRAPPPARGHL